MQESKVTSKGQTTLPRDVRAVLKIDAGIHDCGDKQDFMSANLAVGIQDSDT